MWQEMEYPTGLNPEFGAPLVTLHKLRRLKILESHNISQTFWLYEKNNCMTYLRDYGVFFGLPLQSIQWAIAISQLSNST